VCQTIVTSSSDEKLELAKKLGASHGINYKKTPDWDKEVKTVRFFTGMATASRRSDARVDYQRRRRKPRL
jgi:NADPH:quinone reductase-like Zn-dependent oxidoreductase